ncbi:ATP-grasp domain-containing protein [Streptomyces sp. NPDC020800]|uniref:ATP-grasp domain-containing protein n=1 Tax=Streptomyces sp. NPDC020800 TaxID=3365092 RepID=UPI00378FD671
MGMRTVVIVDPYSSGVMYAPAVRRAGFSPVAVCSDPPPAPQFTAAFRPQDFDARFRAEEGLDALLRALGRLDVAAVLPGAESGVLLADHLAARLTPHLANDPALALHRRHKGLMQQALARHGLPVTPTLTVRHPDEAAPLLTAPPFAGEDLVVKPAAAVCTDGVTLVEGGRDWQAAVTALLGRRNAVGLVNEEVVVQRRLTGTEYVVNTFSHDGRHTVTDLCRYRKVANAGHFAVYQDVEFLPFAGPGHEELVDYVRGALDALGFRFGPAHTEVMLTADGPRLIEVNARVAGSGMAAAAALATGDNGIQRTVRYLSGVQGPVPDAFELARTVRVAMFVAPRPGSVANAEVLHEIQALPTCRGLEVRVRNGDTVAATSDLLSSTALGWALLADRDAAAVERDHRLARACAERLRITA